MSRYWYFYNPVGAGNETDPTQYARVSNDPVGNCISGQLLCAVYAHHNQTLTGKPDGGDLGSTSAIFGYIAESRANLGIPTPIGGKPFVYMRSSTP